MNLYAWGEAAASLFFPQRYCVGCGAPSPGQPLCPACHSAMLAGRSCPRCASFIAASETAAYLCPECRHKQPAFSAASAALPYAGHLRQVLIAFKYEQKTGYRRPLARLLIEQYQLHCGDYACDAVTPVPLHARRLFWRQFNQAAELNDEIVDAYIGLAAAHQLSGDTGEAGRTLSLAASIQQNSTLLFSESATLHFQSILDDGHIDTASEDKVIVMINDVIRAHKDQVRHFESRADVHYKYGILMMVENNYDEAIAAFEKTIRLNPIHYRAKNKLCLCLHDSGQIDQAAAILTGSEDLPAVMLEYYYQTAILYCDRPKFAKALRKIQTQLGEPIQNTAIHTNMETILENLGLVDRAFTNWHRMIETAGNLPSSKSY